jgi:hypothetical protein
VLDDVAGDHHYVGGELVGLVDDGLKVIAADPSREVEVREVSDPEPGEARGESRDGQLEFGEDGAERLIARQGPDQTGIARGKEFACFVGDGDGGRPPPTNNTVRFLVIRQVDARGDSQQGDDCAEPGVGLCEWPGLKSRP